MELHDTLVYAVVLLYLVVLVFGGGVYEIESKTRFIINV